MVLCCNYLKMQGKVFAVTGAGSGIGRATAVRLAELGAAGVAISDVDQTGLEETRSLCMDLHPATSSFCISVLPTTDNEGKAPNIQQRLPSPKWT
jgi:NAD(P)-dependent dehydrogenase (short-subunit alcohol dehydrogenase family)